MVENKETHSTNKRHFLCQGNSFPYTDALVGPELLSLAQNKCPSPQSKGQLGMW